MRIAIDARVLMNEKYSGVAWYAYHLLAALFELDRKNDYVLFYNSRRAVKLPSFPYPNVSYRGYHYPNKLFNLTLNFFSWPKLDRLIGGCDVFFSPNLHFTAWSAGCRKAIAVHDLSFLVERGWFNWKQQWWHRLILRKKILEQADVIVADSASTKNDLIELLAVPAEKIKVVYLGVAPFANNSDGGYEVRKKYDLPEKFFLFVGTIEPRKNLAGLINALDGLPADVVLAVAGDWGWKAKEISNFQFPISKERVKFIGYVSEEEKNALYRSAVALVYPSFYEGFGLPILEAMASGCPVIAGNNSSQGEVLGDSGLLVDPYNAAEIRQAMETVLSDGELRSQFITAGLKRAQAFTWQKTAEQLLEIFEQI